MAYEEENTLSTLVNQLGNYVYQNKNHHDVWVLPNYHNYEFCTEITTTNYHHNEPQTSFV